MDRQTPADAKLAQRDNRVGQLIISCQNNGDLPLPFSHCGERKNNQIARWTGPNKQKPVSNFHVLHVRKILRDLLPHGRLSLITRGIYSPRFVLGAQSNLNASESAS